MSSTDKNRRQKAEGSGQSNARRAHKAFYCLLLTAFCLLAAGCRQDMQDQPRYEIYEPSAFFDDGQASRPFVEGTVPRGAQFRDADAYAYSGKTGGAASTASGTGASAVDAGARAGGAQGGGGVGAGTGNVQAQGAGGGQPTGDVNVRGNVAGGIPGGGNQAAGGGAASATGGADVFPFVISEADLNRGQERFNAFCSMCHGMTGEGDGMIVRRGFRRPPSFHSEQLQPGNASAAHVFDVITNGWGAMPDYSAQIPAEDRWRIIAYVRALQLSRKGKIDDVPASERGKLSGGGQAPTGSPAAEPHGGTQH